MKEHAMPQVQKDIKTLATDLTETKNTIRGFHKTLEGITGKQKEAAGQQVIRFDRIESILDKLVSIISPVPASIHQLNLNSTANYLSPANLTNFQANPTINIGEV